MNLFAVINHSLTQGQKQDAQISLGIKSFVELPVELKKLWGNIPPESEEIGLTLGPIIHWLSSLAQKNDYALIQGDFGAVWWIVNWAFKEKLIPVYSTTRRMAEDKLMPDGSILTIHNVRHCRYRKYGV